MYTSLDLSNDPKSRIETHERHTLFGSANKKIGVRATDSAGNSVDLTLTLAQAERLAQQIAGRMMAMKA